MGAPLAANAPERGASYQCSTARRPVRSMPRSVFAMRAARSGVDCPPLPAISATGLADTTSETATKISDVFDRSGTRGRLR
jgi:hypothetical protein